MDTLPITEVCRRTGLSARALRFYESRGLLSAQRSAAGQRRYGAAELARLHQITALKAAGFGLTRIGELLGTTRPRPRQVDRGAAGASRCNDAPRASTPRSRSLKAAQSALAAGRLPDLDSFCDLIKQGARTMDRYRKRMAESSRPLFLRPNSRRIGAERKFASTFLPTFDQDRLTARNGPISAPALPTPCRWTRPATSAQGFSRRMEGAAGSVHRGRDARK